MLSYVCVSLSYEVWKLLLRCIKCFRSTRSLRSPVEVDKSSCFWCFFFFFFFSALVQFLVVQPGEVVSVFGISVSLD